MSLGLFDYFKGNWKLEREMLIPETKEVYATAKGDARFDPTEAAAALLYGESGKLQMRDAQQQFPFFRHYRYMFTATGLDIYFQDELTQTFGLYQRYIFQPEQHRLRAEEVHVCNKDLYEGGFELAGANHFIHSSVVKGPKKDYVIVTHYTRTD
jgi:hypothetical protein